uniref:Uncharacterized protein n=1 Tax=Periophthalmus magnuspinnatus TaxID=409849 RepID=A0A3B3ZFI6_9GOBI
MENQAAEQHSYEDVQKSGYLRKHKSMHRRFFVLRAASERGPARLEYYENEKKFRSKSPVPKKVLSLETCFNINKRADSKNKHMIVLYTRSESFAIAADSEEIQNEWYQAMLDLQCNCKIHSWDVVGLGDDYGSSGECSSPSPIPTFKEVWQVKVWPKGLGHARNLVGIYRLCLTDKTVNFVKLNSDVASVVLQLMNVRRCGHSENFFFIEVGRSAITGPGEFWMQVDDSVVAQNMHETLLEAMKALSEEFRQRSKSQSVGTSCGTASNPISVPSRRHHPNLPPSQVGFSRRARTETPGSSTSTSPTSRYGFPRARTASIGARSEESGTSGKGTWASSSPSLNGSCSTTPTLRPKPTRAPTPAKITLSLARYTPNPAPSPAPSLSSSSGHGSECGLVGAAVGGMTICSYPRVSQRVSISGSPSDYGSSDEYGSSPGEHSLLVPSLSGHHGEGMSSYIVMGHSHHRPKGRRILRRSSSRECESEHRLLSKRSSLPLASHERLTPHRKEEEDEDEEYTFMSQCADRGATGESKKRGEKSQGAEAGALDSGYMSMLPGVSTPPVSLSLAMSDKGGDEYMAMTPNNSVSPPRHMRQPSTEGYMLMSPNSSSSTDLPGLSMWEGRGSAESQVQSNYMNVSPVSSRSACSTPPSHPEQNQIQPKMFNSYFSLPRAYQHTLSGGCQLSMSSSSFSSSSDGHHPKRGSSKSPKQQRRSRPLSGSDLFKANTLPRVKENLPPKVSQSVGEYVSIVFTEDKYNAHHEGTHHGHSVIHGTLRPVNQPLLCHNNMTNLPRSFSAPLSVPAEYVSMDLGKSSTNPTPVRFNTPQGSSSTTPKVKHTAPSPLAAESNLGFRPGIPSVEPSSLSFSPMKSAKSPEHSSRLVRGDTQGRCNHHADKFNSPPLHPPPSSAPHFPEGNQPPSHRHQDCSQWDSGQAPAAAPQASSSSAQQGLNYIDLDLAVKESPQAGPYNTGGSSSGPSLNTYASIDFYKSEELRAHQSSKKEGQGKCHIGIKYQIVHSIYATP